MKYLFDVVAVTVRYALKTIYILLGKPRNLPDLTACGTADVIITTILPQNMLF